MSKRHAFRIPIGDWSGDGHGRVEWFYASAAKPIDDVRAAYWAAKKKLPEACCPENFCNDYEESDMKAESRSALRKAGYKVPKEIGSEAMVEIVVWFINQGDPNVDVKLDKNPVESLCMSTRTQHVGSFGYGLFF